jgi:hypothetical protein
LGESFQGAGVRVGKPGVRSHSLLATLLGLAAGNASRTRIAGEVVRAAVGRGVYSGSQEDLTPIRSDPWSLVPLAVVLVQLLVNPAAAQRLSGSTVTDYSLTPKAVETISSLEDW